MRILRKIALLAMTIAIATPYGGFSRWYFYEPEMPEELRRK